MWPPFDVWRSSAVAADVALASVADDAALAARQSERLKALLASAARDSPLYRRILRGRDPSTLQLQQLPVMRKPELMDRFEDWVSDPQLRLEALRRFTADAGRIGDAYLGRYTVWESSGSTGEPGVFVQDASAMAVYDALEALRRPALRPLQRLLDPWGLLDRMVFVGALGGHFASTVSIERLRRLNPTLGGRLHSLSFLQPLAKLVAELNALAPTVLATYPSAAVLLATEHLAGRLQIEPQEIWTGGETLSPAMRRYVQQAFGARVTDSYGASEFLSLACECSSGGLHLNSDWAILEPVDEHGRAVPLGQAGASTLLTNLANHVQPLIRYDLGDSVTLHGSTCACGSRLPTLTVQGRGDDTLQLRASDGASVSVLPLAVTTVLEDGAGLFDFQLIQQGPSELLLRGAKPGSASDTSLQRARTLLSRFLAAQGATGIRIHCRGDEPRHRGRSGKVQRIVAQSQRVAASAPTTGSAPGR